MKIFVTAAAFLGFAVSMFAGGAIVEKGEYIFDWSNTFYYDCLGTEVYNEFSVPVKYMVVENPSGKQLYFEEWLPNQLEGTIIDLTTGEVWERTQTTSPYMERTNASGAEMTMYTFKSIFVNIDTGERLMINERYHISTDADGEVHVDTSAHNCHILGPEE